MNDFELNCLSYWFPKIHAAGLRVPSTTIIRAPHDLTGLLDGEKPERWDDLMTTLREAVERHGVPCFLRTGQGSGKHGWEDTCYVSDPAQVGRHVAALVEWSHIVDMFGLPHDVFAVRDLIPTTPLFHCTDFGNFPVTREFRFFMRSDSMELEHIQPYWPPDAVEQGSPDVDNWRALLESANLLTDAEQKYLHILAHRAVVAVGGYWSLDFLQDAIGGWWLTDMALGERSFKWNPEKEEEDEEES